MAKEPNKKTPAKLTPAIIVQAEDLVREGKQTPGVEWREAKTGFAIRFNARGGTYRLRAETATPTLGEVGKTPGHVARHLAREAKEALRAGRDHKAYIDVYTRRIGAGDDHDAAHLTALRASGKSGDVAREAIWTVAELSKHFVEHKLDQLKDGRNAKRFAKLFDDPVFDLIRNKKTCDVMHREFFAIRKSVVPDSGNVTKRAVEIVRYATQMFDYALQHRADVCGLFDRDPVWRAVTVTASSNPRDRAPEPSELARILLAVELHAARKDGIVVASRAIQTLHFFVFFTAQRDGAAASLLRRNFIGYDARPGWRIAHFEPAQMKGRRGGTRAHAVPVPPAVVTAIETMWAEVDPEGSSDYVFPGHRGSGPRAATGLNALFRMLRGHADDRRPKPKKNYKGKPGPKPRPPRVHKPTDLIEVYLRELKPNSQMKTDFTPHDSRRSLTNFLSEQELGHAASAILGHASASAHKKHVEETAEQQMAFTTSRWYFTAQQLDLKARGVELWANALEAALVEERPRVLEIAAAIA